MFMRVFSTRPEKAEAIKKKMTKDLQKQALPDTDYSSNTEGPVGAVRWKLVLFSDIETKLIGMVARPEDGKPGFDVFVHFNSMESAC